MALIGLRRSLETNRRLVKMNLDAQSKGWVSWQYDNERAR